MIENLRSDKIVSDVTLTTLVLEIWRARFFIFFYSFAFCAFFFLALLTITPRYRAEMIVAPADGYALGDYASSVSDGESLSLPFWRPRDAEGISTDFYRFVYTVKGRMVADILLKDDTVLAGISRDGQWVDSAEDWTASELALYLEKNVKIENLGTTPLRRLSYRHPDSVFAATFLRKIHLVADQLIRRDRRRQSESRIDYLKESLGKTVNPEHRKGIANLLMQQEHVRMLANLDEPYAAIVVEPPFSSPRPVWPNKSMILILAAVLGGGVGYFHWSIRREKQKSSTQGAQES